MKPKINFCGDVGLWCCWLPDRPHQIKHELLGWGDTPMDAYREWAYYAGIDTKKGKQMKNINVELSDAAKKHEAMYHLEVCFEPCDALGTPKPKAEIEAHITAAHYLIQSMFDGYKPDNYDEVMADAAKFDAIDEASDAIHRARNLRA
jgi:hypothetical protein